MSFEEILFYVSVGVGFVGIIAGFVSSARDTSPRLALFLTVVGMVGMLAVGLPIRAEYGSVADMHIALSSNRAAETLTSEPSSEPEDEVELSSEEQVESEASSAGGPRKIPTESDFAAEDTALPTPTPEPTPAPTPTPTSSPTPELVSTPNIPKMLTVPVHNKTGVTVDLPEGTLVWLSEKGHSFHNKNNCGNMNADRASQVAIEKAIALNKDACDNCYG